MKKIYLDNGSTSFPKPEQVSEAVYEYMTGNGANISRGGYHSAYSVSEKVYECRQLLAEMFGAPDCKNTVFTGGVTGSINIALKGLIKPGDHFLVSAMEHNAVMRPAVQLQKAGASFDRIPCREDGSLIIEALEPLIRPNTKAVIMLHASNVCGTVMPAEEVGEICKRKGIAFILDCAQTAGILPVDMEKMNIDVLCFTGHKSLLGPQGTGGFILKERMVHMLDPLISGGTGSISHKEDVPEFMPDRFEAGTPNLPGIMGLRAALLWHRRQEPGSILAHELLLTKRFLEGLKPLEETGLIKVFGKKNLCGRIGVVSLQTLKEDPARAAFLLDSEYGIAVRVGLHCAPNAHKVLGSYPAGTIRFSFGFSTEEGEVDAALKALEEIGNGI